MKKKVKIESTVLGVLIIAAGTVWYFYVHPEMRSARAASLVADYKPMGAENSRLHLDRVEDARNTDYRSTGRDIFSREQLPPPIPQVVHLPKPGDTDYVPPVTPPPPPPHLPLKFFGLGTGGFDSIRRAFLTDGDTVYIVAEGDTLLGRYRIVRISRANIEFEEMGTGRRGLVALEDQEPAL